MKYVQMYINKMLCIRIFSNSVGTKFLLVDRKGLHFCNVIGIGRVEKYSCHYEVTHCHIPVSLLFIQMLYYTFETVKHAFKLNIFHISECVFSFSYNCQYQCSEHCINKSCDRFNGSCLHGCMKDKTCALGILIVSYTM